MTGDPQLTATRAAAFVLGALPEGLGQTRLAHEYVVRRKRPSRRVLTQRMRDGTRMALDLGDRTQAIAFLTRRYSPEIVDYIVRRLPPDGTFLDVGANVGLISFAVWRRRPASRIHAFEPVPANVDAWLANRRINAAVTASVQATAVADTSGTLSFRAGGDSGAGRLDEAGDTRVRSVSLDDYAATCGITTIDVLKLDTEGAELSVLRGAAGLLEQGRIRTVVCELIEEHTAHAGHGTPEVIRLLEAHGLVRAPLLARRFGGRRTPTDDGAFELRGEVVSR